MKKLVLFILFLFLIIFGLAGYIAYDKIYLENNGKKVVTKIGEKDIDLNNFIEINETLSKLDRAFNDSNSSYYGYIYNNKELRINKFDEKAALYLILYDYLNNYRNEQTINGKIVEKDFKKIFNNNLEYKASDVKIKDDIFITYNPNNNTYSYNYDINKELYSPEYKVKNISTTIEEESIVIKRKIFYVEYEKNNSSIIANIYDGKDKKSLITKKTLNGNELNIEEIVAKYGYRIHTYKYIFEEKNYNDYYLSKIILEK